MTIVPFRRPSPPPPPPRDPEKPEPREATKPAFTTDLRQHGDGHAKYLWGRPACWGVWVLLQVEPINQTAS